MSEESSFRNDEKLKTLDLEEYVRYLEEKLREYEDEKRKLKLKLKLYKTEIEKLISSPLIEAVVVKVLENNKVLVKSSSGPTLIVDYLPSIKKEELYPGRYVALNQRGSTIVEVLPDREDPYVSSMEVIEKPNVRYSDIGGLD
ncbi:MAG: proteasome-activating nucleotidase, partial [Desulfurococcaceae archaeon]